MPMFSKLSVSFTAHMSHYHESVIDLIFLGLHAPFPGVFRASSINPCCEASIKLSLTLTLAGTSSKDQTVNDREIKKGDRVFLDIENSNVDVCLLLVSLPVVLT